MRLSQAKFGLNVAALAVDLYAWDEKTGEYAPTVVHPDADGSTAVQDDGYLGHVVTVVEDGEQRHIVDAELAVIAPFYGQVAQCEIEGQRYLYRARAEHQEFSDTDAWAKRHQAAAALCSAL